MSEKVAHGIPSQKKIEAHNGAKATITQTPATGVQPGNPARKRRGR